ncbi:alpha/beta fold hydrolase [Halomonas sp. AOP25-F1-15]|uniref:alpha/beta fold hydrolase n=1 Tax=Halomonas sp. AOP25-F1-15 TaxID=3457709 RepID=UPI0040347339
MQLVTLSVPNCGHAPMLDRPEQVMPIERFLIRTAKADVVPNKQTQATKVSPTITQWLTQQWRKWWQ